MSGKDGRDDPPRGFSRRDFLRGGAAAGVLGTGLLRGAAPAEPAVPAAKDGPKAKTEAGVPVVGPGPVPMHFRINGETLSAKLEPRVTLLDALRTRFELTGAKRVCDRGTCGACTVLLNGKAVYACSVLAIEAQGAEIRTVESLGRVEKLHPLQNAFVENDAQQCGFCTPGFLMAAKALLDRNPNPSLAEIHHGLSGNFCRCGTYAGIRKAVLHLAEAGAANPDFAPGQPGAPDTKKKKTGRRKNKPKGKKKHRRGDAGGQ